jgi:Protein of unknown function (DUF1501)
MLTRRQALRTTLFGAATVGLRTLATGLPAALLLDPRRALAEAPAACAAKDKAQFVIFATSGQGDALNANVPGTYEDKGIYHSPDPLLAPGRLTLGGQSFTAAQPWTKLPQDVLDRLTFWHLMTNNPIHPKEPDVLELMGATNGGEMLPSLLARRLAPCLGTIQAQPISLGATTPSEGLTYGGQALPILPALALKATLTNPAGPLTNLQSLRDRTLDDLYGIYKGSATPAQRRYIDSLVTSQAQVRNIRQDLLEQLASIADNSITSQIQAAVTLVQMKVTPVIAVHIPFSGDNHRDVELANEREQTITGVAAIGTLMASLKAAGLTDQVTVMSLNVFGRTLGADSADGRSHNPNHQVSFTIGKGFKAGVVGGVGKVDKDYGALPIDSKTGRASASGDVSAEDTLASFGRTMLAAVGVAPADVARDVTKGKILTSALV